MRNFTPTPVGAGINTSIPQGVELIIPPALMRAPGLLSGSRYQSTSPRTRLVLNKSHPLSAGIAGCWYLGYGEGMNVDLAGYNHGTWKGGSGEIAWANQRGLRGLTVASDPSSGRIDLGSIDSSNPLSMSSSQALTVFTLCTFFNGDAGNNNPRIIDKSNSGSASGGWYFGVNGPSDSSPNSVAFTVNGAAYYSPNNVITANDGLIHTMSVHAESGNTTFYVDGLWVGQNTGTWTIPSITTNAALLNWNHTSDRQWRNGTVALVMVWNRRVYGPALRLLHYNPFALLMLP